jgi:hypothetical protein
MELFSRRHVLSLPPEQARKPLFTDFTYDNLGIPQSRQSILYNAR